MAQALSLTPAMPQRPDWMSIADLDGNTLYSAKLASANPGDKVTE